MKNRIKVLRAIKDITQAELAKALQVARTINFIEKNKCSPSLKLSLRMAEYFGVTVEEIFMLEDADWEGRKLNDQLEPGRSTV